MKALFSNLRISIYVCLLVFLLSTACFLYIPKGLLSAVDQLQRTVDSKRALVQTLQHVPEQKTIPTLQVADNWLNKVPYDPQISRILLQLQDYMQQTNISLESIATQSKNSNSDINQQLINLNGQVQNLPNGIKAANGQVQKQASGSTSANVMKIQTKSEQVTLSVKGSYMNMTQFLNLLYQAPRIIHIDMLSFSHKELTQPTTSSSAMGVMNPITQSVNPGGMASRGGAQIGGIVQDSSALTNKSGTAQTPILQENNPSSQEPAGGNSKTNSNATTLTGTNYDSPIIQFNNSLKSLSPKELQDMSSVLAAFQSIQQQSGANLPDLNHQQISQTNQPFAVPQSPPVQIASDEVSVSLTLSIYYIPDVSFLGTLPDIPTYNQSGRMNLVK